MLFMAANSFGLLSAAPVQAQAETQPLDWVVAVVEDSVVLNSELLRDIKQLRNNIKKNNYPLPPDDVLRDEVMERLILERIQLQMGKKHGVVVSDERLYETMQRIAEQRGVNDVEGLQKALKKEDRDLTAYRQQLREEITIDEVQRGNMRNRIQLNDNEINQYLKSHKGESIALGQYQIIHVHIPYDVDKNNAKSLKKATQCATTIRQAVVKQEEEEGINTLRNNKKCNAKYYDLGWLDFADVPTIFEEILPSLRAGQLSPNTVSDNGIHLAWLRERRGGSQQWITQYKVHHILQIPSIVKPEESVVTELKELMQRIENGEDFNTLAISYSEDPGSRLKGGDLDWVSPGDTDPQFEAAINNTPIGTLSLPIQTAFGWHVLRVDEKREFNIAPQMIRRQVRNNIYQKKYQEELETWLDKIRDEAHVQIR